MLVHGREDVGEVADRLGIAEHQEPPGLQGVMEVGNDPLLNGRLEVDQQIAAADEIQVREGRIGRDVLPGEDAHVADRFSDLVPPSTLTKKRRSRSGETSTIEFSRYTPVRARSIALSATSVAKIWMTGFIEVSESDSKSAIAME